MMLYTSWNNDDLELDVALDVFTTDTGCPSSSFTFPWTSSRQHNYLQCIGKFVAQAVSALSPQFLINIKKSWSWAVQLCDRHPVVSRDLIRTGSHFNFRANFVEKVWNMTNDLWLTQPGPGSLQPLFDSGGTRGRFNTPVLCVVSWSISMTFFVQVRTCCNRDLATFGTYRVWEKFQDREKEAAKQSQSSRKETKVTQC